MKNPDLSPKQVIVVMFMLFVAAIAALVILRNREESRRVASARTEADRRQREEADRIARERGEMTALAQFILDAKVPSDNSAVTTNCERLLPEYKNAAIKTKCASAYLGLAKALEELQRYEEARSRLNLAEFYGESDVKLAKRIEVGQARTSKLWAVEQERQGAVQRAEKAKALRELFLDKGLDIKVRVSGKNNTRLTLEWPLFSDVWSHRWEKDGTINSMLDAGFKRVHMTDGYDWGYYWER